MYRKGIRLPSEHDLDRLEELRDMLARFSDSILAKCWEHEIEYLECVQDYRPVPEHLVNLGYLS